MVSLLLADTGAGEPVPLPNVSSKILSKVIEYAKFHLADKPAEAATEAAPKEPGEEAKAFDAEFVKVDQGTLFELILVSGGGGSGGRATGRELLPGLTALLPPFRRPTT